jgi:hypothetical protein
MSKKLLVLFISVIAAAQCFSMDRAHFQELNQKGRELKKKQDWAGLLQILIEVGKEMPAITPTYALRMASVETHLGNKAAALQWMERYAAMGLTYNLAGDADLKPLLSEAGWKKIAAQMEQHAVAVMHADEVCTLPIVDLMPEDITFDKTSGTFIVSSIQHHSLYRVSLPKKSDSPLKVSENSKSECEVKELPLEAQAKHWPVMAVSFDGSARLLRVPEGG